MTASAFDTLKAMRGPEAAVPEQAEANAARDAATEGAAAKGDILRVDNDTGFTSLNGKIDAHATETRADIKQLDDKIDALAKDAKAARLEAGMTTLVAAGIAAIKYL